MLPLCSREGVVSRRFINIQICHDSASSLELLAFELRRGLRRRPSGVGSVQQRQRSRSPASGDLPKTPPANVTGIRQTTFASRRGNSQANFGRRGTES